MFIIVLGLTTPLVQGTLPGNMFQTWYRIKGNGVDTPNGYWVYGTLQNNDFTHKREVIVEVTLLDSQGATLDTVTTMVRPTIIANGERGSFLAKSNTQVDVAEIKYKVESFKDTGNTNFDYIQVTEAVKQDNGVSGKISNVHEFIYVFEAEAIITFLDVDGNVVDIKSYGANGYGQFDPQTTEQFTVESTSAFDSFLVSTQCNRASRIPYMIREVERPSSTGTFTPPVGETIILVLRENPFRGAEYIEATITNPDGESSVEQFVMTAEKDFRYEITPEVAGVWNLTYTRDAYLVNNSIVLVEPLNFESGFFIYDPDATTENTGEDKPSPDEDTNTTEIIDSITSKADEVIESLPESVKQGIPGYPVTSILAALAASYVLVKRRK